MLAEKGSRFLTGETLCCFDCELMPKLQHVRVAGTLRRCTSLTRSPSPTLPTRTSSTSTNSSRVSGRRRERSWSLPPTPPPSHPHSPPEQGPPSSTGQLVSLSGDAAS